MRFPEFLKEHGTIGFVAPSFGCATEPYYTAFAHARERFGQMGYHTQMGRIAWWIRESGSATTRHYVAKN